MKRVGMIMMISSDHSNQPDVRKGTFFLTSARLGFRRWRAEDIDLASLLWSDPEVTRLIDARGRLTTEQVRERLIREISTEAKYGVQYWPVFLLKSGEFIGCCGLRPYRPEEQLWEIGVHLRHSYWGGGYGTEAVESVTAYAFRELELPALFAGHNPDNHGSRRLLLKAGFRHTHDEYYPPTGLQHPSYILTREEFDLNGRDR